jgi:transcriptional pleiotropic regulator of transition state genes
MLYNSGKKGVSMKSTGVVRKVEHLGRISLPSGLRRKLNFAKGDLVEVYIEDGMLVIKKHTPSCVFCQSVERLVEFEDRYICGKCVAKLAKGEFLPI